MRYDRFLGLVQNRARLADPGEAVRATRATLEVLSQRLIGGEAAELAAQLPEEIQPFLLRFAGGEDFGLGEFYLRVREIEGTDMPIAVFHARAVISVLKDAVSPGEFEDMLAQLPDEYNTLFEWEAESPGEMKAA